MEAGKVNKIENLSKVTQSEIEKFIPPDHAIMNFQPVVKIDRFGKKKIDRVIVLTTHQILIAYEGGLELEIKSSLDIKFLAYIIKSTDNESEMLLCFGNRQKSSMHIHCEEDPDEFFDFLKLRWINFNPTKSLRVFGVPSKDFLQYHAANNTKNYNIQNLPGEECRLKDEEVVSQEEFYAQ